MNGNTVRWAIAVGGMALAMTAGAATATADPDVGPMVNTTCNYDQVMAALEAQDPAAAAQFNASPISKSSLHQFLAAPPDQRQQMAQMVASQPANQQYFGLIQQVFATCNNY